MRKIDSESIFTIVIIIFVIIGIVMSVIKGGLSSLLPLIMIAVLIGIAFLAFWRKKKKNERKSDLLAHGRKINAEIISYEVNRGVSVNDFHAVRLICRGSDNITYYSNNYYVTSVLSYVGEEAVVYVDKNDPRNYIVNIPGLPDENYGPNNVPLAVGMLFCFIGAFGTLISCWIMIDFLIRGEALWWLPFPFMGFSLLFGVLGLFLCLHYRTPNVRTEPEILKITGTRLRGTVTECKEIRTVSINGLHPIKLCAEATDENGKTRRFTANNIYLSDPQKAIGKSIDIYVSSNGRIYYIDLPEFKKTLRQ